MSQAWRKYTQTQIATGSPIKITIMVYEKCILNIRTAQEKLNEGDYQTVSERLINTEMLLNELIFQLDRNVYPELSEELIMLYEWSIAEERTMNIKKDARLGDPVIQVIQNLLDGYTEAMNQNG